MHIIRSCIAGAEAEFTVYNGFGVFRASSKRMNNMPFHRAAYTDEDCWKHPEDGEELHVVVFSEPPLFQYNLLGMMWFWPKELRCINYM